MTIGEPGPRESAVSEPSIPADRLCFEDFFAAEYAAIVRIAAVLTGSVAIAEDLAQDAFVAASLKWDRISTYDDPRAWVRRAVLNRSASRFRRQASEQRALRRLRRPPAIELPPIRDDVWIAVRRLPRRQVQVLLLTVLDGRTIDDVGQILGCSVNTVRTHLARARARLATELTRSDG
jgi:RNA polymerase sigma-70 factor (ECF subfamily)